MTLEERKTLMNLYLGKMVDIQIDRPLGSVHPKHPDLIYPINYGYLPNVTGGDGEDLDVYLLGVKVPVTAYTARVIGIIHRYNDIEDRLVAAPEGMHFTQEEIADAVRFQEQYYEIQIDNIDNKLEQKGRNNYEARTWNWQMRTGLLLVFRKYTLCRMQLRRVSGYRMVRKSPV